MESCMEPYPYFLMVKVPPPFFLSKYLCSVLFDSEPNVYLFFYSLVVKRTWENLLWLVNLRWVVPKSVSLLITQWRAPHLRPKAKKNCFCQSTLLFGSFSVYGNGWYLISRVETFILFGTFLFTLCCWAKTNPLFSMYPVDSLSNLGAFLLPREMVPWFTPSSTNEVQKKKKKTDTFLFSKPLRYTNLLCIRL